jgi:hypothetical protein
MAIRKEVIRSKIATISQIPNINMDYAALVQDLICLAAAFPDEKTYDKACESTVDALKKIVEGKVQSAGLKYDFSDWKSYHYQSVVAQGAKADCRIMFRRIDGGIEVKGFGHRSTPADFYKRMSAAR